MKRHAILLLVFLAACAGEGPKNAGRRPDDLAGELATAFDEEAKGSPRSARKMYLDVAARAATMPDDPWQMDALEAALDALVLRSIPAFEDETDGSALAYRTDDATELAGEAGTPAKLPEDAIGARLSAAYWSADGPFAKGFIARAMLDLAEHKGDAADAAVWRERTGCAREAVVLGPLDWAPVTGVHRPDPLEAFDAKLAKSYPASGAFAPVATPTLARGHGCTLDLTTPSPMTGVRDVVVDLDVARGGSIGVALRAQGEATLRVGGKVVLERPYELGGAAVARFARVHVLPGKVRVVARVGMDVDGGTVEIDAWDEHGVALSMHAPRVGEAANVPVTVAMPLLPPPPRTDPERVAAAAGALAAGDGRTAERLLEGIEKTAPPDVTLLYARAVETARDLSSVERSERARSAYERVLEAWPMSWEAILAHARLAGVRRGEGDARIEILRDLDVLRAKGEASTLPLLDAFDAATSAKERLYDRAHAAFERARATLEKTSLLVEVGKIALGHVGTEHAAYVCSPLPPHSRKTMDCYAALFETGDLAGSERELQRLREVRGGESLFFPSTLRDALVQGDVDRAARTLAAMSPGEVSLSDLYAVARFAGSPVPLEGSPQALQGDPTGRLHDAVTLARDAPQAWPPLLRALGDDPTHPFAGIAEQLSRDDRAHPMLETAATAVLAHTERYDVDAMGVVHALLFDVRRVSGTTDVEENAQADPPELLGRSTMRILRRRILKRDGRVIEPDPTPRASQGHADLSQLEAGDLVEAIYEGWAVPGETGDIGIDSPDLLPGRTSIHEATIQLTFPRRVALGRWLWSHPLLGKPQQTFDQDKSILTFKVEDQKSRRVEEGTPKMDRSVSISFGTADWKTVGEGLSEVTASLDDHDPAVAAWARKAVATAEDNPRAKVAAIVIAAGRSVKEASASALTDLAFDRAQGPQSTTARTILTNGEGSRTWLIIRALREIGIAAEVVVAENEPYSESDTFPPHAGRFLHPLAVAHIPRSGGGEELVWIDADVPGPPLPSGRISPELRGRSALHADGSIAPLPLTSMEGDEDDIDLRLLVQPNGDAKGTLSVLLRGREAQEIAEMLLRVVGDDRQKALRGVALAWVPFADVDDVVLSSSEGSWQIAVRAELTILSYAEPKGTSKSPTSWLLPGLEPLHNVYPRPFAGLLGATYAAQGKRQSAFAVSHAVQYRAHRRVELPKGARVTTLPGPIDVKTDHLEASRKISVSGSVIEEEFVLGVPTGTVTSNAYEAFVADLRRTDDGFLAATRVRLLP
jgi:hypothetical protein